MNTFGRLFRLTTFGQSHGPCMGGVVDGVPAGFPLSEALIQPFLDTRKPGASVVSTRSEPDQVQFLSGIYEGKTTGAPIGFTIPNMDVRSADYAATKTVFRPGHADYTYFHKYGHYDPLGGGRASARETVCRVVAGGIAQCILAQYGITFTTRVVQIGPLEANVFSPTDNPFYFADPQQLSQLDALFEKLREQNDSCGARVRCVIDNVPAGLGEPIYNKLSATLAYALMGINAVKGVSIGEGFEVCGQYGSEHRDPITRAGFTKNDAGGILGGISTGEPIVIEVALKPTSSIAQPIQSIDQQGKECEVVVKGRHDPCVGIRAVPVIQAMAAMVICDHLLYRNGEKATQNFLSSSCFS